MVEGERKSLSIVLKAAPEDQEWGWRRWCQGWWSLCSHLDLGEVYTRLVSPAPPPPSPPLLILWCSFESYGGAFPLPLHHALLFHHQPTPILTSRPSHGGCRTHSETRNTKNSFLGSAAAARGLGLESDPGFWTVLYRILIQLLVQIYVVYIDKEPFKQFNQTFNAVLCGLCWQRSIKAADLN